MVSRRKAKGVKIINGVIFTLHSQSLTKSRAIAKVNSLRNWFKKVRRFKNPKGHYDIYVHKAKR